MNVRALTERFIWGLVRPAKLLWGLRQQPEAFQRAMKTAAVQVVATLALASGVVAYRADELADDRAEKRRAPKVKRVFELPRPPPVAVELEQPEAPPELPEPAGAVASSEGPESPDDDEAEQRAGEDMPSPAAVEGAKLEAREWVADNLEAQSQPAEPGQKRALREAAVKLRKELRLRPAPPPPVSSKEKDAVEISDAIDEAERSAEQGKAEEGEDEEAKLPWWQRLWALAVSAVFAAQWVVLALARDYQDRTSRDLSLVAGVFPEEADQTPRVRIDWKWLRRKLRRRIRGLQVLIPGFLIASPLLFLAKISELPVITTVLTGGWAFYWWTVFTASRTARAWVWEETARPNAPLRGWMWLTQHVPGFRWWGPRFVTWVWLRTTRALFSPAMAVELDPAAFAGLGAARLLATIPLVRIVVRPVMSVVAAEIVIRRAFRSPALADSRLAILEPSQHARDQAGV